MASSFTNKELVIFFAIYFDDFFFLCNFVNKGKENG